MCIPRQQSKNTDYWFFGVKFVLNVFKKKIAKLILYNVHFTHFVVQYTLIKYV